MGRDCRNINHRGNPITATMVQKEMISAGVWRCCANCINYSPATGCGLADPPREPPAYIAVVGCPAWEDDIPF